MEGEEKARSSGVTLTAGAATKLIINTAALVAVGSHDIKATILYDNFLFLVKDWLIQIFHRFGGIAELDDVLRILLALGGIGGYSEDIIKVKRRQIVALGLLDCDCGILESESDVFVDGAGEVVFRGRRGECSGLLFADDPLVDKDRSHLDAGHCGRTATEQNISATSSHVSCHGHNASPACLSNNLTLTSGIFGRCIEELGLDSLFS